MSEQNRLVQGPITKSLICFAAPMMVGNLLQQFYNIADTLIVGRFLGATALAAVGSSYTLMTFLTSILLGMSMGSGAVFSICYGENGWEKLRSSIFHSFVLIATVTVVLTGAVFWGIRPILSFLQVPNDVRPLMQEYLWIIFLGLPVVFLYNYFAALLRSVGNSIIPLIFLGISAVLNILLDLAYVLIFQWGVAGAAWATIFSQAVAGFGIAGYTMLRFPQFRLQRQEMKWNIKMPSRLILLLICQRRILEMHFQHLLHKIMEPSRKGAFKRVSTVR